MEHSVHLMKDLTEEDEDNLPLPDDWIRTIRMASAANSGKQERIYRNLKTGVESEEHPFILQALNMSRKRTLPVGWIVKEVVYQDGTKDYSYFNTELGISMWDPPLLRECLSECLIVSGFNPYLLNILPGGPPQQQQQQQPILMSEQEEYEDDGLIQYYNHPEDDHPDEESLLNYYNQEDLPDCAPPADEPDPLFPHSGSSNINSGDHNHNRLSLEDLTGHGDDNDVSSLDGSQVNLTRNWEQLLNAHIDKNNEYADKISHRVRQVRPPISASGVAVLKSDVTEANERIHQLLIKLRTVLCNKSGVECSFLYHTAPADTNSSDYDALADLELQQKNRYITLASDIVTSLKQHPEHIVLAMAATNKAGNPAMIQIAFTALHRLLHPFSTDNSMTTAILLQGINYQLDEMTLVEQIFSDMDAKRILSRALLISDPVLAIKWNPLSAPLPVVPVAKEETVLACLLRLYAIRRDVTSYYRTTWKPMIPSVIAVLNSDQPGPHVFGNLMAVANRLLECTLLERSMLSFPPTATAICRAMHEIGGHHTLHSYLFSFLILPNLVKILAGDHESVENENLYRLDTIRVFVDKYFDSSLWFSNDSEEGHVGMSSSLSVGTAGAATAGAGSGLNFNPLRALIWLVWRLYMHAIYVRGSALTVLTTANFVGNRLPKVDLSAIPDTKLKNIIERLHRKIDRAADYLLKLPLDAQGSEYLGIDRSINQMPATDSAELLKLLNKRMSSLHFKPNEMLNLGVVSKQDIGNLFTDVGVALEMSGQSETSPLYQAIAEYLSLCSPDDGDESREELIQLVFLFSKKQSAEITDLLTAPEPEEQFTSDVELTGRYHQLLRGLTLTNRYEDILIQMIYRVENNREYSVFDLLPVDSKDRPSDFTEAPPEFDANMGLDDIRLARQHTSVSSKKLKGSHFGLHTPAQAAAVPLFSSKNAGAAVAATASAVVAAPEVEGHHARDQKFFQSYRFGTASSSVNAGTSMARNKVLPPRLKPDAVSVTNVNNIKSARTKNSRSQYTKVTIKPNSNILAPTASYKSQEYKAVTERDHDRSFMKGMREYDVIPAEEFQQRHNQRMRQHRGGGDDASEGSSAARRHTAASRRRKANTRSSTVAAPIYAPQPFPEYLRPRVRPADGEMDEQHGNYVGGGGGGAGGSVGGSMKSRGSSGKKKTVPVSAGGVNAQQINQLISDYRQVFVNNKPHSLSYQPSPSPGRAYSNTSSGQRLVAREPRSPSMPQPIPGTNFFAPTQSLLRRMNAENGNQKSPLGSTSNMRPRLLHDLAQGAMPGLRSYPNTSGFVAPPFVPTKSRQYAPTGPRIPRIPDFLSDSGSSRSGSRSRGSSRSNSRSNSRASSPSFSRSSSRNNSYNNLAQSGGAYDDQDQYYNYGRQERGRAGPDAEGGVDDRYYSVNYDSPEGAMRDNFDVEYDDESSRFVLNSKKSPTTTAALSGEAFRQQQLRQQKELEQEEQEYLRRLSENNREFKSPVPVRHPIAVGQQKQHQQQHQYVSSEVDSTPAARTKVPSMTEKVSPRSRDDGLNQSGGSRQQSGNSEAGVQRLKSIYVAPEEQEPMPEPPASNAWNSAVSAAIRSSADAATSPIPAPAPSTAAAAAPSSVSPRRRSSAAASTAAAMAATAEAATSPIILMPPPPPVDEPSVIIPTPTAADHTTHAATSPPPPGPLKVAPIVAQLGGAGTYRRSSTGSAVQLQAVAANAAAAVSGVRSPQTRRASVATAGSAPVHRSRPESASTSAESGPTIIIPSPPPASPNDNEAGGGESGVNSTAVAAATSPLESRKPLANVTPLRQSSYSLMFEEINKSYDPSQQDNDVHYHRYDTNLDQELAKARLNAGLPDFPESDEEDPYAYAGSRYIMDSPRRKVGGSGDVRFVDSPMGRIPIIKKKSMILTKDESKTFLINGFKATKYGRSGGPKLKFVCYNEQDDTIDWEAVQTSVFSGLFKSKDTKEVSYIECDSVIEVRRGIQTQVFMKAKLVDPRCCLSIVTDERTLDLALSTPSERDIVIKGLVALFEGTEVRFL